MRLVRWYNIAKQHLTGNFLVLALVLGLNFSCSFSFSSLQAIILVLVQYTRTQPCSQASSQIKSGRRPGNEANYNLLKDVLISFTFSIIFQKQHQYVTDSLISELVAMFLYNIYCKEYYSERVCSAVDNITPLLPLGQVLANYARTKFSA